MYNEDDSSSESASESTKNARQYASQRIGGCACGGVGFVASMVGLGFLIWLTCAYINDEDDIKIELPILICLWICDFIGCATSTAASIASLIACARDCGFWSKKSYTRLEDSEDLTTGSSVELLEPELDV